MGGFSPGGGGGGDAGLGSIPIIGPIISGLAGLFGGPDPVWASLAGVSQNGLSSINGVEDFLNSTVEGIKKVFHTVWVGIILGAIKKILDAYKKLRELIQKVLGPIAHILRKLRQLYNEYVLKPMLRWVNLIQQIRKFLVVFRLLGFKWATKLDNLLTKAERRVVQNTLVLQAWINFALDIVDLAIDPSLILRKNFLLASLLSFLGAVKRVVLFGANRTPSAAETQQGQQDSGSLSKGSKLLVSGFGSDAQYHPTVQRVLPCMDAAISYYQAAPSNG